MFKISNKTFLSTEAIVFKLGFLGLLILDLTRSGLCIALTNLRKTEETANEQIEANLQLKIRGACPP